MSRAFLLLPVCGLGDALCYLPTIAALRAEYSEARIVTVAATEEARELIESASLGTEVIVFNRGAKHVFFSQLGLIWWLRRQRFDVAMSRGPLNSVRIPLVAFLSGAKWRIGAKHERLNLLYNVLVDVRDEVHAVEKYRAILGGIGIHVERGTFRPNLRPPLNMRDSAEEIWRTAGLTAGKGVVGLASGADTNVRGNWDPALKRWGVKGYAAVVQWLARKAGVQVVMFGVGQETRLAEEIRASAGTNVINLCGRTSVGELEWLLKKCKALVCNDTGTMHLAAALGTPVLALFGPTSPSSFGPLGERHHVLQGKAICSPCFPHPTCDLKRCLAMEAITPAQVIEHLAVLLNL